MYKELLLLCIHPSVEEFVLIAWSCCSLSCHHHHVVQLSLQILPSNIDIIFLDTSCCPNSWLMLLPNRTLDYWLLSDIGCSQHWIVWFVLIWRIDNASIASAGRDTHWNVFAILLTNLTEHPRIRKISRLWHMLLLAYHLHHSILIINVLC